MGRSARDADRLLLFAKVGHDFKPAIAVGAAVGQHGRRQPHGPSVEVASSLLSAALPGAALRMRAIAVATATRDQSAAADGGFSVLRIDGQPGLGIFGAEASVFGIGPLHRRARFIAIDEHAALAQPARQRRRHEAIDMRDGINRPAGIEVDAAHAELFAVVDERQAAHGELQRGQELSRPR